MTARRRTNACSPIILAVIRRRNMLGAAILVNGRLTTTHLSSLAHRPRRRSKSTQVCDTLARLIEAHRPTVLVVEPTLSASTSLRAAIDHREPRMRPSVAETSLSAAISVLSHRGQHGGRLDVYTRLLGSQSVMPTERWGRRGLLTQRSLSVKLMAFCLGAAAHHALY